MTRHRQVLYDQVADKKHFGSALLVQHGEDWDAVRKAKQKCRECSVYDPLMAGCKRIMIPGECER
jgi:hypothetical protein